MEEDRQSFIVSTPRRESEPRVQGNRGGNRYKEEPAVSSATAGKVRVWVLPGPDREAGKKDNNRNMEGDYRTSRAGAADKAGTGPQSAPKQDQARAGEGNLRVKSRISD